MHVVPSLTSIWRGSTYCHFWAGDYWAHSQYQPQWNVRDLIFVIRRQAQLGATRVTSVSCVSCSIFSQVFRSLHDKIDQSLIASSLKFQRWPPTLVEKHCSWLVVAHSMNGSVFWFSCLVSLLGYWEFLSISDASSSWCTQCTSMSSRPQIFLGSAIV